MAWWALYKWFIPFRKTPYTNWIRWYRIYLYDVWFENLSDSEKKRELDRIKKQKEKRQREYEDTLKSFGMMFNILDRATNGHLDYIVDAYNIASRPLNYGKSKYW